MSESVELVRQNKAITVLELMFSGETKGEACRKVNIAENTFDAIIAAFPQLTEEFSILVRARMLKFAEELTQQRVDNVKSISLFMKQLRDILDDEDEDLTEKIKAFNALIKADKHAAAIFKYVLPAVPSPPDPDPEPGIKMSETVRRVGTEIMKEFEGAKLREIQITAKMSDDRDILDGDFNTPDDVPSQSDPVE